MSKIHFDDYNTVFKDYNFGNEQNNRELEFNRINIFVGANNSGKSRFLRELFKQHRIKELDKLNGQFKHIDFPYIKIQKAIEIFQPVFKSYLETKTKDSKLKNDEEYIDKCLQRFQAPNHYSVVKEEVIKKVADIPLSKSKNYLSFNEYSNIINEINLTKSGLTEIVGPHNDLFTEIYEKEKNKLKDYSFSTYIPILRTLKKVSLGKDLLFRQRTYIDYFTDINSEKEANIFTGEDLYSTIEKTIKSLNRKKRDNFKLFQKFIEENFFKENFEMHALDSVDEDEEGNNSSNNYEDITILIGNGDNNERRIPFLGDGIQSLIILIFPLFLYKDKNHVLFIDEPEINLHPGLQRLFFETLNHEYFKNTRIFISTHSNHLLNIATECKEDISVFSFNKDLESNQFHVKDISQRASVALDLLGVHNSSVFLSNCTIWVEGISDRIHFKKYLDIYCEENDKKEFIEDYHFAFIEYGGSNIKHWSFFDSENENGEKMSFDAISNNVFLLVDNDNKEKGYHEKMKERLGDIYNYLDCLEIENLITPEILKKVLYEYRIKKQDVDYENFVLGKKTINYEDYKNKPIGNFIHSLMSEDDQMTKSFIHEIPRKKSENKFSIGDKRKFNQHAMDKIEHWSDLSKEAQLLTEKIYSFIENNNQ